MDKTYMLILVLISWPATNHSNICYHDCWHTEPVGQRCWLSLRASHLADFSYTLAELGLTQASSKCWKRGWAPMQWT